MSDETTGFSLWRVISCKIASPRCHGITTPEVVIYWVIDRSGGSGLLWSGRILIMDIQNALPEHIYSALFGYIFVEELGIPLLIPGDAIMILLGIEYSQGDIGFPLVLLISIVATWLGSSLLFLFARRVGRPFVLRHEKLLKFLHISNSDIQLLEHYMQNHGTWILVVARIIPGLRTLATITAGILDVSYKKFILATTLGTILWTYAYFFLGAFLGRRYEAQIEAFFSNKLLLLPLFVVGLLLWVSLFKYLLPALKRHRHIE